MNIIVALVLAGAGLVDDKNAKAWWLAAVIAYVVIGALVGHPGNLDATDIGR